jgi:hypothetical protein
MGRQYDGYCLRIGTRGWAVVNSATNLPVYIMVEEFFSM